MSNDWKPTTYSRFKGTLIGTAAGDIRYSGTERDWNVIGNTPEENLRLGRCIVLISKRNGSLDQRLFGMGGTEGSTESRRERAEDGLRRSIELYLERKSA